ncbi:MAG: hypothetical protein M3O62_05020, partial [Pseudomonadota bacterium]|nr:hypothetical protein [Pseudomonadota bacterium]
VQSTRQTALFGLYQSSGQDLVAMYIDDIKDQWETTGLRQTDCQIAIEEMVGSDFIRTYPTSTGMLAYLTEHGLAEVQSPTLPPAERLHDWFTLQRAQWRRHHASTSQRKLRRRRADDIPDPV